MDLRTYLFMMKITSVQFSKLLECNRHYLSLILNGHKKPGKRFAKDIETLTNGAVTVTDLMYKYEKLNRANKVINRSVDK